MTGPQLGIFRPEPLRPGRSNNAPPLVVEDRQRNLEDLSRSLGGLSSTLARLSEVKERKADSEAVREGEGSASPEATLGATSVADAQARGLIGPLGSDQARFSAERTFGRARAQVLIADLSDGLTEALTQGELAGSTRPSDIARFLQKRVTSWRTENLKGATADEVGAFNEDATRQVSQLLQRATTAQAERVRARTSSGLYAAASAIIRTGKEGAALDLQEMANRAVMEDGADPMIVQEAVSRALLSSVLESRDPSLSKLADQVTIGGTLLADVQEFKDRRQTAEDQADQSRTSRRNLQITERNITRTLAWVPLVEQMEALIGQGVPLDEVSKRFRGKAFASGLGDMFSEWEVGTSRSGDVSDPQIFKSLATLVGSGRISVEAVARQRGHLNADDYLNFMRQALDTTRYNTARADDARAKRDGTFYAHLDPGMSGWANTVNGALRSRFGNMLDTNAQITSSGLEAYRTAASQITEQEWRALTAEEQAEATQYLTDKVVAFVQQNDPTGLAKPMVQASPLTIPRSPKVKGMVERLRMPRIQRPPRVQARAVEEFDAVSRDPIRLQVWARQQRLGSVDEAKKAVQEARLYYEASGELQPKPAPGVPKTTP